MEKVKVIFVGSPADAGLNDRALLLETEPMDGDDVIQRIDKM